MVGLVRKVKARVGEITQLVKVRLTTNTLKKVNAQGLAKWLCE